MTKTEKNLDSTQVVNFSNKNKLYETILENGTSTFITISDTGVFEKISEVFDESGERFTPLHAKSVFIKSRSLILPTGIGDSCDDVYEHIRRFIHKYVDVSERFESILPYYVMMTWIYEDFNEVPYLRIIGDTGGGKTRLTQTVGSICQKPTMCSGATTLSPIFRMIDQFGGTVVIDEADMKYSDTTSSLIKVFNSGYTKGSAILRTEGDKKREPTSFNVFCPKIIASRESFDDRALENRSIREYMGVKKTRSDIPVSIGPDFYEEVSQLQNKLLLWRFQNLGKEKCLVNLSDKVINVLNGRPLQIILPLLKIIKNKSHKISLIKHMVEQGSQMKELHSITVEGIIVRILIESITQAERPNIYLSEITTLYNKTLSNPSWYLKPQNIGGILTKQLHLKIKRVSNGTVINIPENLENIEYLKKKYLPNDDNEDNEDIVKEDWFTNDDTIIA